MPPKFQTPFSTRPVGFNPREMEQSLMLLMEQKKSELKTK